LLFVFSCIGMPVIVFFFTLPIKFVKYLSAGFVQLDSERIPEHDWILFKLYCAINDAAKYWITVFAWLIALCVLWIFSMIRGWLPGSGCLARYREPPIRRRERFFA